MKWSKERDDLIAQTKAFVQSVTGRKPQVAPEPVSVRPVQIENPFAEPVSDAAPVSNPVAATVAVENLVPIENPISAKPIERIEQTSDLPPAPVQSDVRKEIQSRVAAFQAHQHRFNRERDAYYNSVLAKARSDIKNGPDTPRS